jgi:hypothetical protein
MPSDAKKTVQEQESSFRSALKAAILADKPEDKLPSSVHALYEFIKKDPQLKSEFEKAFLNKILKEINHHAEIGSTGDISRHQMLCTLYGDIPAVQEHINIFNTKLDHNIYSWVAPIMRRIESGVSTAMQIGNEFLLAQSLKDLQLYVALTTGEGAFKKLNLQIKNDLKSFFHKQLLGSYPTDFNKWYQRKIQLDKIVVLLDKFRILGTGLEDIKTTIETDPGLETVRKWIQAYAKRLELEGEKEILEQAKRGEAAAVLALEIFNNQQLKPDLRKAIDNSVLNYPGVTAWIEEKEFLIRVLERVRQGNVALHLESVVSDIKRLKDVAAEAEKNWPISKK